VGKENRKASPEIRWRLSTNVERLRQARGDTQQELAKRCGLSKTYIGNVEQGTVNISLANLEALAIGLRCSEEDLLRPPPVKVTGPDGYRPPELRKFVRHRHLGCQTECKEA